VKTKCAGISGTESLEAIKCPETPFGSLRTVGNIFLTIRYLIIILLSFSCVNYHPKERFIWFEQISGRKINTITSIGCYRYFVDCEELKLTKQVLIGDSIVLSDKFNAHLRFGNTVVVKDKIRLGYLKDHLLPDYFKDKNIILKLYFYDLKDSCLYSFKSIRR
jgi:hypothetical protein